MTSSFFHGISPITSIFYSVWWLFLYNSYICLSSRRNPITEIYPPLIPTFSPLGSQLISTSMRSYVMETKQNKEGALGDIWKYKSKQFHWAMFEVCGNDKWACNFIEDIPGALYMIKTRSTPVVKGGITKIEVDLSLGQILPFQKSSLDTRVLKNNLVCSQHSAMN